MEREIFKDLIRWNNSKRRKTLIIRGASQVGKTYIIKKLQKNFGFENKIKSVPLYAAFCI